MTPERLRVAQELLETAEERFKMAEELLETIEERLVMVEEPSSVARRDGAAADARGGG